MGSETPIQRLERIFHLQKQAFLRDPAPSAEERIERMARVPLMLYRHREAILAALAEDFGGHSREQGDLTEIIGMFERARFNCANVQRWMQPQPREVDAATQGQSRAYVQHQPKGVIGNMVSWNFPFDIGLGPTLDALGAGNRVIVKPSEHTPACGRLLQAMIAETFDEDLLAVVNGDLDLARHFPGLPWDHLVYTGSTRVGREVMKAAAANLVPVTLELGGKCPAIVGRDKLGDPRTLATLAGVKALKRGQVCVSVDYCLVPEEGLEDFCSALAGHMRTSFAADNAVANACGIINQAHLQRLQHLLDDAQARGARIVRIGDGMPAGSRDMPLHLVIDPADDSAIMQEEVFGPLLPIKTYRDSEEVIQRLNRQDPPLGIYLFSDDRAFTDEIARRTRSGGLALNVAVMQAALPSMGFGGVGASGMGRHHGEEGFREFSNPRGYYERREGGTFEWVLPPYSDATRHLIDTLVYGAFAEALGNDR